MRYNLIIKLKGYYGISEGKETDFEINIV